MIAASAVLHGLGFAVVLEARPAPRTVVETIEVEYVRPEPPPPPPPAAEEAPAPAPSAIPPARPAPRRAAPVKAQPPAPAPAAAPQAASKPAPPVPVRIGISLSSTATGGGFAVGVGNSLMGKADRRAADPSSVQEIEGDPAPVFVPPTRVSTQPRVLSQPKAEYPLEARKEGVEGQVLLLLRIDAQGRVVSARVLEGPGFGLDQAAREAALRMRFSPATVDGAPVATEIRFTYTFLLE